jgi:outer membrane protein TolC
MLDRAIVDAIAERQQQALGERQSIDTQPPERIEPGPKAYESSPRATADALPPEFHTSAESDKMPDEDIVTRMVSKLENSTTSAPTSRPVQRYRDQPFTLTDALRYASRWRRELQSAKEDLYLAALALMLERHLWTPRFAAELRGVYGNFGEVTDFDQATRFVADMSVAQRLPYGGEFTARAVSTIIRDVKRSITAEEGSTIELGFRQPLLRGAGYVAREALVDLERNLTYATRTFERFRRQQLLVVAREYFGLLRSKQAVIDADASIAGALFAWRRAEALEGTEEGDPLDTGRAKQRFLSESNRAERLREQFRFATDEFKLLIGMPVDEPVGLDDLETINAIEQRIRDGEYPLLRRAPAALDEDLSLAIAERFRLDLLNTYDRVDDARRGVAVSANTLLPNLDWTGSLNFETDPEHFRFGHFETARANWRSEVVLSMDDRFRERTDYRRARIDLNRASRDAVDASERVRVDVRRAINEIPLQETLVEIQDKNIEVARRRLDYSQELYEEGDIGNRDLVEAQDELVSAQDELNLAKTDRWTQLLEYRLATGTLWIREDGQQEAPVE